jgi:hypothetical protein
MHLKHLLVLAAVCVGGCASQLQVWDNANKEVNGVPFRATEVYKITGTYNRHSENGEACTATDFEKTASLPTGNQYFANVKPGSLSKAEFGMTFADSGSLASITMNTEPAAADTINAATTALSTLLPFAGVTPKTTPAPAPTVAGVPVGTTSTLPACDTGLKGRLTYERFQP